VGRIDRGASVVEFVMMCGLLVVLLFGVLQVAVYVYVRNVVAASAADGARFAAAAGADLPSGGQRAAGLIDAALSRSTAHRLSCVSTRSVDAPSGLATVAVRCRGRLRPVLLSVGLPIAIDVTSSALQEHSP
jgi:Flp pilus assembly protein TadG